MTGPAKNIGLHYAPALKLRLTRGVHLRIGATVRYANTLEHCWVRLEGSLWPFSHSVVWLQQSNLSSKGEGFNADDQPVGPQGP